MTPRHGPTEKSTPATRARSYAALARCTVASLAVSPPQAASVSVARPTAIIRSRIDPVGHEDRVHLLALADVVPAAEALAHEPEGLVQVDRGVVPREDVQLELAHADLLRPRDRLVEQTAPDSAAPVGGGHHQSEIGDVRARRMRVAREREAGNDLTVV